MSTRRWHAFGPPRARSQPTISPGAHKAGGPQAASRASGHRISALVVIAVDLLKEGLGVECVGWAGDAGDDRKCNQGGQNGLHACEAPPTYTSFVNDSPLQC